MGRRQKPASVKRATGNPGRRPIPEVRVADTGPATMPPYLARNRRAAALWAEYAPALVALGTLTKASETLFAKWCALEAAFQKRPSDATAAMIGKTVDLASRLGLDPSSLAKFSTPHGDGDEDPAEGYFTGPQAVVG